MPRRSGGGARPYRLPAMLAREGTLAASAADSKTILISAGEASGELYGAELVKELRRRRPGLQFFGVGGERMRSAGCDTVVDAGDLSVVGITEIVAHLPNIYGHFCQLVRAMEQRRPAVVVVIDSPAFNLRVAREAHRRGIPVIYYVAPQFWAWRQWRTRLIRKYVRKALVIFPFEADFYRKWGVDAEFVGHPLVDLAPQIAPRENFARAHGLDAAKPWIALLPGSRRKEVLMNLPAMLGAAGALGQDYDFVVPVATTLSRVWMEEQAGKAAPAAGFRLAFGRDVHSTLAHARAAVVASGTATVQAALAATPFVMVYRVSPMTYALGRPLVRLEHFGMVNLIAREPLVPELVQGDFTADNVVRRLAPLLEEGPQRAQMVAGLGRVRELLKQGGGDQSATRRAADAVLQLIP